MKKILNLSNGTLELTELKEGTIILGELKSGFTTANELRISLHKNGYPFGIIEDNLTAIENGSKNQYPLAVLKEVNEAPGFKYQVQHSIPEELLQNGILNEQFEEVDVAFPVKKGTVLLTITEPAQKILLYPDGRKRILKVYDDSIHEKFCGSNTRFDKENKSIISTIDGLWHRSIYNVLSVFPAHEFANISKTVKSELPDGALRVDGDVLPESSIDIPSNLWVNGKIRSSFITVEGNIYSKFGIANPNEIESAFIHAGQNIRTAFIENSNVWAGESILCEKGIQKSEVCAMNSIASPVISESQITVGNKLYAKNIVRNTYIVMGSDFIKEMKLMELKGFHSQHEKKLHDLDNFLTQTQVNMEAIQNKVKIHLINLKRSSQNSIKSDMILKRFFDSLSEDFRKFVQGIKLYDEELKVFEKESPVISLYERILDMNKSPELIVTGFIEPGVVINTPNQTFKVNRTLRGISVKIDPFKGSLEFTPLNEEPVNTMDNVTA